MHFPLSHWLDPRVRIARALTYPRVAVSLVALAALLAGLLFVRPDLGRHPADSLRLTARSVAPSTYLRATNEPIRFIKARGTRTVSRRTYEYSTWSSAWLTPPRTFTELVPSWNAQTPAGSWIQVIVQVRTITGTISRAKYFGRWTLRDGDLKRASGGAQSDAVARVATDTLIATDAPLQSYRLRVKLMRAPGGPSPVVTSLGAVTSAPQTTLPTPSTPLRTTAVSLPVPSYSQMTHLGQAPRYGGGGEAWCSPTSLSMVLGYYGRLPAPATYTWVPRRYADRWVNHVARLTYDARYRGTGNWPFNTAYAATRTGAALVTRLASLRMAERFIRSGIPLVVSIKFARGELSGAPISATAGHLVVLSGFTAAGDPIVHDPAAPNNNTVRRVYDRAEFEHAWLRGSFGLTYVIHDANHPLPAKPKGVRNW